MKSRIRCCRGVMSDTVATLLVGRRTLASDMGECKHMFDCTLDIEHVFGHRRAMASARIRRRRSAVIAIGITLVLAAPVVSHAVGPERRAATRHYVVQPGDTLWSIASRQAPER